MKIGIRAHDLGRKSVEILPEYIKNFGFKGVHFAPTKAIEGVTTFNDITDDILYSCRENFEKNNIEFSVYGCYVEIGLLNKDKRLDEVNKFLRGIEHNKILGATIVGTETTNFPINGQNREKAYECVKDSVLRIAEKAEKENVNFAIEPVALHTINTPELTHRLIEEVNSNKLKIIVDSVNLFTIENIKNQKKIITDCFKYFGDRITTLHIKDITLVDNRNVENLKLVNDTFKWEVIGEGIVDYKYIFSLVKDKNISFIREGATLESCKKDIENIEMFIGD